MEKFWKKYIEADILEKEELLTPVLKRIREVCEMDIEEPHKTTAINNMMMSYFDDLISVMYTLENHETEE